MCVAGSVTTGGNMDGESLMAPLEVPNQRSPMSSANEALGLVSIPVNPLFSVNDEIRPVLLSYLFSPRLVPMNRLPDLSG